MWFAAETCTDRSPGHRLSALRRRCLRSLVAAEGSVARVSMRQLQRGWRESPRVLNFFSRLNMAPVHRSYGSPRSQTSGRKHSSLSIHHAAARGQQTRLFAARAPARAAQGWSGRSLGAGAELGAPPEAGWRAHASDEPVPAFGGECPLRVAARGPAGPRADFEAGGPPLHHRHARDAVARGARPERGAHICSRPRFEDDADARVAERRLAGARRRGADARRTTGGARTALKASLGLLAAAPPRQKRTTPPRCPSWSVLLI